MLAKQVALFAIELQLCARQPEKALALITYVENQLMMANTGGMKLLDKASRNVEKKEKKAVEFCHLFAFSWLHLANF